MGFVSGHGTSYVTHHYLFEDTTVIFNNLYYYRLKQLDNNGGFAYKDTIFVYFTTGIDESSYDLEAEYSLHQNYPNPFNPETIIPFKIIEDGYYRISLYNISGEYVKEITSGYFSKGDYNTKLVAEKLTSGVYFYRLEAAKGEFLQMKLIILK